MPKSRQEPTCEPSEPAREAAREAGGPAGASERFGPLWLQRNVRDDGRALILYGRDRDGRSLGSQDSDRQDLNSQGLNRQELNRQSLDSQGSVASGSVSELRFEQLRGEHVAYAIHRQDRTFLPPEDRCPLCPTRPGDTPTEIPFPAFEIVVFDNRFPAFAADAPSGGAAEVVVYTDRHDGSLGTLPAARVEDLMWVWRQRYHELGARADVGYVFIFENRGVEVGVTLHHPHGQIYGYPFVPPVPALELAADVRLGGCAPCLLLRRELADGRRVLFENDAVVVYVPYAARWSYEAHVMLREHRPSLLHCEPQELRLLAQALQRLVRGYDALFARPFPHVLAVHQAPTDGRAGGHLHVELYPPLRTAERLKYLAGSEQGAGTFLADTLPERAAEALREAIAGAA